MRYEGMERPKAKAKEPSLDTGRDINRITRVEKTFQELMEQPQCLEKTIEYTKSHMDSFLDDLKDREINRIVLIGCGDSWFVGTCLESLLEKLTGCICQSIDAFECFTCKCENMNDKTIIIGQSASGTTSCVLGALEKARSKGAYTIGISNTENAEILTKSDFGLLIQANRKGWPTQATSSAIAAIAFLFSSLMVYKSKNTEYALEVVSELSEKISGKMASAIEGNKDLIQREIGKYKYDEYFQASGNGSMFGVAQIAGAKLKELCPVHSSSFPLEEFHHYRTLKQDDTLLLFMNNNNSLKREIDTALVGAYDGGKIITVGTKIPEEIASVSDLCCTVPSTVEELQPIVSMTVAHLFAYYLAKKKYDENIGYKERK